MAQLAWDKLMAEAIPVLAADPVTATLCALTQMLDEIQVVLLLTDQVRRQLHTIEAPAEPMPQRRLTGSEASAVAC